MGKLVGGKEYDQIHLYVNIALSNKKYNRKRKKSHSNDPTLEL